MIKLLEDNLGYTFRDKELLYRALTHSSYANEHFHDGLKSNERLEFLGDSILGMVTAQHLYSTFPQRLEGDLTRIRADMVCETALAAVAKKLNLGSYLRLGNGEEQSGGRLRPSIQADAVEAVIAAMYLDGGMEPARNFISRFVLTETPVKQLKNVDYKTALQEFVQQEKNQVLTYEEMGQYGPDHDKHFQMAVRLNGKLIGTGTGTSKKRAEQDAAREALEKLK